MNSNKGQKRKRRRNRTNNKGNGIQNNSNLNQTGSKTTPQPKLTKSQQRRLRRKNHPTRNNNTKQEIKTHDNNIAKKSNPNKFSHLTAEQYGKKFMKWNSKYLHDVVLSAYIRPIIVKCRNYGSYDNSNIGNIKMQLIVFGYIRSAMNIPEDVIQVIVNYSDTSVHIPVNIYKLCSSYLYSFVKWERWTHLGLGDFVDDVCEWRMAPSSHHAHYRVDWIHINLSATFYRFNEIEKRVFVRKLMASGSEQWPHQNIGYFDVTLNALNDGYTDHHKYAATLFRDNIEHLEYILYKKWNKLGIISLSNINLNDNDIVYICNILENIYIYKYGQKGEIKTKEKGAEIIDLSSNNITDKYIALLLRTINKYVPSLKELILAHNKITNKSILSIMKYDVYGLTVNLTGCSAVTFKALNKHQRGDYNDGSYIRYCFCKNSVYFGNKQEPQSAIKTKMKKSKDCAIVYHRQWH